jgi:hypothetical protein
MPHDSHSSAAKTSNGWISPFSSMSFMKVLKLIWVAIVLTATFGATRAFAATYTVTSTGDSGTGTLRAAIGLATSGSDTIQFNLTWPATISLTSDELRLIANVSITGPGAASLTLSSNGTYRIFENDGFQVNISGLTLTGGGGNSASSNLYPGTGGAIINTSGTLTLTGITLTSNTGVEGGAIANNGNGTVNLNSSTVTNNQVLTSTLSGLGGGIFNYGTLHVSGSTISNNSAVANSGGTLATGGGGIYNANVVTGAVTITNSTISGNAGGSQGGGIENNAGTLTITNSTISNNTSLGVNGGRGQGGGIENFGPATITGSTISGNTSTGGGGGIANQAPLAITNSTIVNNSAGFNGGGIQHGGLTDTLAISFSTFYGNVSGTSGFLGQGDGIANGGTAILKNNILAMSTAAGGNCHMFTGSSATSQNYNLSDDQSCASFFTQSGDLNGTAAGLSATGLASNGGPTQTIALLAGSHAIDSIPVSPTNSCTDTNGNPVTTDQRGTTRPQGTACDMGAFELQATTPQTITFGPLSDVPLGNASFTVSATASSGLPVSFNSQTPSICGTSGTNGATVTVGAVGTCTIQATQLGNAVYAAATPVNQSFQVTAAILLSQSITFGALANQPINAAPFAVSATASSGLPVSFNSQTSTICSASGTNGSTITVLTTGTCTIQATQSGNATYAAALAINQSFQVTLLSQTISFSALPNLPLTSNPFTFSATASSALPVSFESATPSVCTTSGTAGTLVGAGICTIQATQQGNATYAAASAVNQSFSVFLVPLFYGTASRVIDVDQFPGDFVDITTGDFFKTSSPFSLFSTVGIATANPAVQTPTPSNLAGLTTGAWSESATALMSARGIAFRNFVNQTNSNITTRLTAIFSGQFLPSPFGLPLAPALAGAAIHVFDGSSFYATISASGKTAGQFLLDTYTVPLNFPSGLGISSLPAPDQVIAQLDSVFPGGPLGHGATFLTDTASFGLYQGEPLSTPVSVSFSTNLFTVKPQQEITVVFDAATYAGLVILADGTTGGGNGYFLNTVEPAATFFTDSNGNPVTGLAAVGGPAPIPALPSPAQISLAPATASTVAGTTATITATVTDNATSPVANQVVTFNITSGPNTGTQGAGVTDVNGQFAFTYTGTGPAGTDTIQASIGSLMSNLVYHTWTSSQLTSGLACNGTYNGPFQGNLTVTPGQNCILVNSTIAGNINQMGGTLSISNSKVEGNITVQDNSAFFSNGQSVVTGNLAIQNISSGMAPSQVCRTTLQRNLTVQHNASAVAIGSASVGCAGNTVLGNVSLQYNQGPTSLVGNQITGNAADQNNNGTTVVLDNTIGGSLGCQGNATITGSGNTSQGGKSGQCSAF